MKWPLPLFLNGIGDLSNALRVQNSFGSYLQYSRCAFEGMLTYSHNFALERDIEINLATLLKYQATHRARLPSLDVTWYWTSITIVGMNDTQFNNILSTSVSCIF